MMFIERTNYTAKPGRAADVLQVRRRASEIRIQLGLPAGTIYQRHAGVTEGPDVEWQCGFPTLAANEQDMAARAASPAFAAVREEMHAVVDHFERHLVQRIVTADWGGDVDLAGQAIVPSELRFPSDGRELAGYLYLPPGDGPFPCMISNHGSTIHQGTDDVCRPAVAATLMSWGIASFMPHRRGYGNSPGTPWRDEVSSDFGSPAYDDEVAARLHRESDDVLAALDYVAGLPTILPGRIGVMGSSFGGTNTLLAASRDARFRCAVEFAGAAMNWERTPKLREMMFDAARQLPCPTFFIQAANDFSIAPTKELAAALADTDKVIESRIYPAFGVTPMEGHLFERNGTMLWGDDVRRFLERWL